MKATDFVDLHVHTTNSDGCDEPVEVVKMAAEHGVAVMAVTDHDNLRGLGQAIDAGKILGVQVISGVELSTVFHGHTIHILGYGIPLGDAGFHSFLGELFAYRKAAVIKKMEMISEARKVEGKNSIDLVDFIQKQGTFFNREKAAEYLVQNGFMDEREKAFQALACMKTGIESPVTAERAIEAVHRAGGVAISAHPFAHGTSLRKLDPTAEGQEKLLHELVAAGLDGLECYQSEYGPEETSLALSLAQKYGLLISAGSDWHGPASKISWNIKELKTHYPEHVGGLEVTVGEVAPLLQRLGISIDKS